MKRKLFKFSAILLILVMTFSLTACSSLLSGLFNLGGGLKNQSTEDGSTEVTISEEELDQQLQNAGALSGAITISMGWATNDDLDLHLIIPNGEEIYYNYKTSSDGGTLDVDQQADAAYLVASPVENIYSSTPSAGHYQLYVENYEDRTPDSATSYLIRVTVGSVSETFEGTLDGTGNEILITEFDY